MQWTLILLGLATVAIAMWSWNLDPDPATLDRVGQPPVEPLTRDP